MAQQYFLNRIRAELDDRLRVYEGILTPGQMGQLHAIITEEKSQADALREAAAAQREAQRIAELNGDDPDATDLE